jgi:hypothetical protein
MTHARHYLIEVLPAASVAEIAKEVFERSPSLIASYVRHASKRQINAMAKCVGIVALVRNARAENLTDAASLLGRLNARQRVEVIPALLHDANQDVRMAAIRCLGSGAGRLAGATHRAA